MYKIFGLVLIAFILNNLSAQSHKWEWGNKPPLPLKKVDLNSSFLVNSNSNFFQFDAIIYPISLFFNDRTQVFDYGLGGGISTIQNSQLDPYVKLLINKDWKNNWPKKSRWGNDLIANYLFNSNQFNFGINLSYTKKLGEAISLKLKVGPSYFTKNNELLVNSTISIALENEIQLRQVKKPVVYFYPADTIKLNVSLKFSGDLTFCYPKFRDEWSFTLYPNSTFIDNSNCKKFPYLFWEGDYDLSQIEKIDKGFTVTNKNLVQFFEEKLAILGLNRREITDFITFWTPILKKENYQIKFVTQEDCSDIAQYGFSSNPDTFIRVIALFKPISEFEEIKPQTLTHISRKGFTIVEWGGIEVHEKKL